MKKILLHVHTETTRNLDPQSNMTTKTDTMDFSQFIKFHELEPDAHKKLYNSQTLFNILAELIEREVNSRVIYIEFRYNPFRWISAGMQPDTLFSVIEDAVQWASREKNITCRSIICFRRGVQRNNLEKIINSIDQLKPKTLVGIDLAGDERQYPDVNYIKDIFQYASKIGLGITVHAGEFGEPENIWKAILELGAQRIGHGLSAVKDSSLLEYLSKNQIMLEISLSSNLFLGAVSDMKSHPIRFFIEKGIPVSINTDIPAALNITMNHEFETAKAIGLSEIELGKINRDSVLFSFASNNVKEKLLQEISAD